jgi:hypothetical protein
LNPNATKRKLQVISVLTKKSIIWFFWIFLITTSFFSRCEVKELLTEFCEFCEEFWEREIVSSLFSFNFSLSKQIIFSVNFSGILLSKQISDFSRTIIFLII